MRSVPTLAPKHLQTSLSLPQRPRRAMVFAFKMPTFPCHIVFSKGQGANKTWFTSKCGRGQRCMLGCGGAAAGRDTAESQFLRKAAVASPSHHPQPSLAGEKRGAAVFLERDPLVVFMHMPCLLLLLCGSGFYFYFYFSMLFSSYSCSSSALLTLPCLPLIGLEGFSFSPSTSTFTSHRPSVAQCDACRSCLSYLYSYTYMCMHVRRK